MASGPQSLRRASSMELVSDVPLRMKHPALPFLVSGLNEIALVNNFHLMYFPTGAIKKRKGKFVVHAKSK